MRSFLVSLAIVSFLSSVASAGDDNAIKDRLDQFQSAWNKDDVSGIAALFTEDGTLINPVGVFAHGRDEVAKVVGQEHAGRFKASKYEISDVKVQWVTADIAVADISANISGVHGPDGAAAPDYAHHVVWVFVKKDGKWMVAAARPYQFGGKPGEMK